MSESMKALLVKFNKDSEYLIRLLIAFHIMQQVVLAQSLIFAIRTW